MRIIGIDPGLARVGYGIIDEIEGKKIMLDCGIIETKSTQKEEKRLVEISNDLNSIIKKWNPNTAAVEKELYFLAILGVIFSVISAFYYLKIVKIIYFENSDDPLVLEQTPELRIIIFICLTITCLIFLFLPFLQQIVLNHLL